MKLRLIYPVLTAIVMACPSAQLPYHDMDVLLERAIDPSTMDPVRYSVLSVLHTAMPTGSNMALPTGNVEPDWYKNLPQDVKNILPSLYPVTVKAAAATPSSVMAYASASSIAPPSTSSSSPSSKANYPVSSTSKTTNMYIPSYTASTNSSVATSRPANMTVPIGSTRPAPPLASQTYSTGTKTAIGTAKLTALMWLGVGVGITILA